MKFLLFQAGQHWLLLVDQFGPSGFTLLLAVLTEVVGLAWGFGWFGCFFITTFFVGESISDKAGSV